MYDVRCTIYVVQYWDCLFILRQLSCFTYHVYDAIDLPSITQQAQMAANLGKAHHFVHLKHDAIGPHHIEVRTDDSHTSFTQSDLPSYHPHSATLSPSHKEDITNAFSFYRTHLRHLIAKHKTPDNTAKAAWPFYFISDPTSKTTSFSAALPNMVETIQYVPSKSRFHGFTLNVLACLHPDWTDCLQQLIPLTLTTRILPKAMKITGRTLIDKPKTTDKRPISIQQAFDSYLDTIVNARLASTI